MKEEFDKTTKIKTSLKEFQHSFRTVFSPQDTVALVSSIALAMKVASETDIFRSDLETCLSKIMIAIPDRQREITLEHLKSAGIDLTVEFSKDRQRVILNKCESDCQDHPEEILH